jgi:quercetin dioxygenase-like cupin family protein
MPDYSSPSRQQLLEAKLEASLQVDRVRVVRVELAPGQSVGRHRHPCPVIGWVLAGAIRLQIADEPEQILRGGEVFYEPANTLIAPVDNTSADEPATFLACYLLPPGEDRVIEMLDPATAIP